jgi:serine/threonine protein kinase
MALGSGDRVGQYVVHREIGKGAMATVYEAEHVGLGKRVALKRLHPHLATDARGVSRFLREGRAATQIRHLHVVEVFDVGTHDGVPYLVMDLLDGVDLSALLRERKKLAPSEVVDILLPVASAVHAAHEAGVVHRDLKPSNILLARRDGDGRASPVVLDFGISKLARDAEPDLTASEVLLGTVHYMSPEQTRGGKNASPASDQYALGVMLYEGLTGAKPFVGSTPYAIMHAVVSASVLPPSAIDRSLPPALDDVVLRAMHRDPGDRFPSVRALGAALLPWASAETRERHAGEFGANASVVRARARPVPRRRRMLVAIGVAATAAALGVGARSLLSQGRPTVWAPSAAAVAASVVSTPVGFPETTAAPEQPAAAIPSARRIPTPRATTGAPTNLSAPPGRPERGTNGALIVE